MKVCARPVVNSDDEPTGVISYWLWCPACDEAVRIDNQRWTWNGDSEVATFSPSILTRQHNNRVCHSFVENGVWRYLDDCTHDKAGQSVPMVDVPDWVIGR